MNPRLYFIQIVKAITHREIWVQRHRNGFESRTARVNLEENIDKEMSVEGKERQRKALQSFAKEFGRQRTRGKTKERAGTLPLALSMFRRDASAYGEVDLLKEVQGSEGQTTVQDTAEEYGIIYSKAT